MATKTRAVRKDSAIGGRFYEVDGESYPSVTHILTAISKPALIAWSANTERAAVTEAAADLYGEWCAQIVPPTMPRDAYLATLYARLGLVKAHQKELAKAGEIGTQIHKKIEWAMRTGIGADAGPEPTVSDKAEWGFMAFQDWAKSVSLKPVLIETTVYSKIHGFAGTMDLLGRVHGVLTLIDFKSGRAVYSESFLQSAAYSAALVEMGYVLPSAALIVRLPKNETDPDFEVVTVPDPAALLPVFLATKQLWAWQYAQEEAYRARRAAAVA